MTINKPWLKNYPADVSHKLDEIKFKNLVEFYDYFSQLHNSNTAFSSMGMEITFTQTQQLSKKIATWLQLKATPRTNIAIMSPNCLQYPVLTQSIHRANMVVVNLNPLLSSRELSEIIEDSNIEIIFIWNGSAHLLDKITSSGNLKHIVVMSIADYAPTIKQIIINFVLKKIKKIIPKYSLENFQTTSLKEINNEVKTLDYDNNIEKLNYDDLAFLQYTGGTTGKPKGVMLSHGNMLANLTQTTQFIPQSLKGCNYKLNVITALPLYHIFALTANYHVMYGLGIKNILITNPKDLDTFIKTLVANPPNIITGVNTLFNVLANHKDINKVDFSGLQFSLGGGMSIQKATSNIWLKVTNCFISEAYGLSETSPAATMSPHNAKGYTGSIGLPIPNTDITIIDDNEQIVKQGDSGEIVIKGPQVMQGYWHNELATQESFTQDGWFKTGDIGYMDQEGYFYILDRKKDMVIVSGFNVYPTEVEQVINNMESVLECGCIGIADEHSGEIVKAFVVKKDNANITKTEIYAHCKEELSLYKVPKQIEFVNELPKTNIGKILRRSLK